MKKFILISAIILLIGAGKSFAYTVGETLVYGACTYGQNYQKTVDLTNLTATLQAVAVCGKPGNVVVAAQLANGTWKTLMSSTNEGQKTATWEGTWIKCEIVMSNSEGSNNIQGPVYGILYIIGM